MKKQLKPKLSKEQKAEKKKRSDFSKQVNDIFINSGFEKLNVKNWHFSLQFVDIELDHCFIFENILIICEDTAKNSPLFTKNIHDSTVHRTKKDRASKLIKENKKQFIDLLSNKFNECVSVRKYLSTEFKVFYLYFDYDAKRYTDEQRGTYPNLLLIDKPVFNYFVMMSKSIKKSFRYEIFRFLQLKENDVGRSSFDRQNDDIRANIIYPVNSTGYSDDIRIVSFMMSPEKLIKYSYVLRKDGWDENTELYQRLISPKRIKDVRKFVVDQKTSFLNNVIVTLPDNVSVCEIVNNNPTPKTWDDLVRFTGNQYSIIIPSEFNSIGIIDGQHRIYAYYEDNVENEEEKNVSKLRNELNLLVTGIVYKQGGKYYNNPSEQRKFESNLFVAINKNAKQVDADTIIKVQSIMNPTSGAAVSRRIIELMNANDPFVNLFELSKTEKAPIKTASIIQYALSSLVTCKNVPTSFYKYWLLKEGLPETYEIGDDSANLKSYINYCVHNLREYFRAVKDRFLSAWNPNSKLLKVISLNAFLIALRDSLECLGGPKKFAFYVNALANLKIDFSNENKVFPYAGAQYSKFAKEKIIPLLKAEKQKEDSLK